MGENGVIWGWWGGVMASLSKLVGGRNQHLEILTFFALSLQINIGRKDCTSSDNMLWNEFLCTLGISLVGNFGIFSETIAQLKNYFHFVSKM